LTISVNKKQKTLYSYPDLERVLEPRMVDFHRMCPACNHAGTHC